MRRQILTIMALAGVVMLAGCKKQGIETVPSGEGAVVFTATTGGGGEKTLLYPSENGAVKWETGDAIKVNNGDYELTDGAGETSGTFTYSTDAAPSAPYCAVYPNANGNSVSGSTVTLTLPDTQTLTENSFGNGANPMVAYSASETTLSFKNVCGALRIKLYGDFAVINKVTLESASSKKLCGTYTVNANSDTPTLTYSTGGGSTLTLTGDAVLLSDDKDSPTEFYAVLPVGSYSANDITVKAYFGDTEVASVGISMAFTIERSAVTVVQTAGAEVSTASCLVPGIFSIGSGTQVYFSKGNLYYNSGWYFDANQWDTHTDSPAISGSTYYYITWARIATASNTPITISTVNGASGVGFRVMTLGEWWYLLGRTPGRSTYSSSGHFYFKGTVHSKFGLIILPDNWEDSWYSSVPAASYNNTGSINISVSDSDWTTLESKGCVFLPVAGYARNYVMNFTSCAYYMSTTAANDAYGLYFDSGSLSMGTYYKGDGGYSVRLVSVK